MAKQSLLILVGLLIIIAEISAIKIEMTKVYGQRPSSFAQVGSNWDYDENKKEVGWNGTFDNKIALESTTNNQGAIYVGKLFISDDSQPLKVIFDTGSDYLAITSSLCSSKTFGAKFKNTVKSDEIHIDKIQFDGIEKMSWNSKDSEAVQQSKDASALIQLGDADDYKNEVEVQPPMKIVKEEKKEETWGPPKPRCNTQAYNLAQSGEKQEIPEDSVNLNYGSAQLKGKLYKDKLCIDPIQNRCSSDFQFLALYDAEGLGSDIDGILGLANHKDTEKRHLNFIWSLKDNNVIDKAVVAFSTAPNGSYAQFGTYNLSEVVGGEQGLYSLKTFNYMPDFVSANKNWALEGQNLLYGGEGLNNGSQSFPAIIDTGSSTLGVPPQLFDAVKTEVQKEVQLDCQTNDDFCQVKDEQCVDLAKKLKPIGFKMGGKVFEVPPSIYLNQAEGKCQFGLYRNDLGGDSKGLFIIGEPLLQHLYMVYDLENEEIKLGVNVQSQGKINIH